MKMPTRTSRSFFSLADRRFMMEDKQLMEGLTEALRTGGFTGIEKRTSSRSITLSAHKGHHTAIVHIEDREATPGPRSPMNTEVPDPGEIVIRPEVPSLAGRSGSGGTPSGGPRRAGA
jgi:hypothetical protein